MKKLTTRYAPLNLTFLVAFKLEKSLRIKKSLNWVNDVENKENVTLRGSFIYHYRLGRMFLKGVSLMITIYVPDDY